MNINVEKCEKAAYKFVNIMATDVNNESECIVTAFMILKSCLTSGLKFAKEKEPYKEWVEELLNDIRNEINKD